VKLRALVGDGSVLCFVSPFRRTLQTLRGILLGGGWHCDDGFDALHCPDVRPRTTRSSSSGLADTPTTGTPLVAGASRSEVPTTHSCALLAQLHASGEMPAGTVPSVTADRYHSVTTCAVLLRQLRCCVSCVAASAALLHQLRWCVSCVVLLRRVVAAFCDCYTLFAACRPKAFVRVDPRLREPLFAVVTVSSCGTLVTLVANTQPSVLPAARRRLSEVQRQGVRVAAVV
jgi:hypothetical protein